METQKTLFGYNVKQIKKRIRTVDTLGGKTKRVFCLPHPSASVLVGFDILLENDEVLVVSSGKKEWQLTKQVNTFTRKGGARHEAD